MFDRLITVNLYRRIVTKMLPLVGFMSMFLVSVAPADSTTTRPGVPTLEIVQHLFRRLGEEIIGSSGIHRGDTVSLTVSPSSDDWVVRTPMLDLLQAHEVVVYQRTDADVTVPIDLRIENADFSVRYEKSAGDGFFRIGDVSRTVTATVSARSFRISDGRVLYGATTTAAAVDTVPFDDLDLLEDPAVPRSRGERPDGPIFERLIEPFIIIGATGIIVYLLFTVRS